MIVGIDEVGRGAWAGPLCIAAVALGGYEIEGLTDSKKLTKKKRDYYSDLIKQNASLVGIGWVSAAVIDRIGMSKALKLAARRAVAQLDLSEVSQIIIDGTIQLLEDSRAITMKQADLLVPSVSAASVIAKVARDSYMEQIAGLFPEYEFEKHVGYGTAAHTKALQNCGPSPLHRMSFSPMKTTTPSSPHTHMKSDGYIAEDVAAAYLRDHGYKVIERNWKTKWCEVDIIASKERKLYFVEVKYRKQDTWGKGTDAITREKLRQMKFAAELWFASHGYEDGVLSTISLAGPDYRVEEFIEVIL